MIAGLALGGPERGVDNVRLSGASADGAWDNPRAAWLNQFFEGHSVVWHLAFLNVHLNEHAIGEALACAFAA